jgi:hypothetical protein
MGNQMDGKDNQNKTDNNVQECKSEPLVTESAKSHNHHPNVANRENQNTAIKLSIFEKIKTYFSKPTISDWFIAAATIAIFVTSFLQFQILHKSNDISLATQRAFVNFKTIMGVRVVDPIKKRLIAIQMIVTWENTGTTPTKTATGTSNIQLWRSQLPETFTYDDVTKLKPMKAVIGPKGIGSHILSIDINDLIDAQQGKAHLFSWGSMVYHDIFEGTPPRLTEYCVEIINVRSTKTDPTDPANIFAWDLIQCPTHNCYDENCPDYDKRTK